MNNKKFKNICNNLFFQGINEDDLMTLELDNFKEKYYKKGEIIIEQDTKGDFMLLIISGDTQISKIIHSTSVELGCRGANDFVGEMALFDGELRSANVEAKTDVEGYIIDSKFFFELFDRYDQVKINIIHVINSILRDNGNKIGSKSVNHSKQLSLKQIELDKIRTLLNETMELKHHIDEQKCELELINRELEKRNRDLNQLAIVDDLTRLYSKKYFMNLLDIEFLRSRRNDIVFTFLIIDIDDFSEVNNNLGYIVGDRILKEFSGIISELIREEDVLGRIDGDKLGLILPHQTTDEAVELAKMLLNRSYTFVINEKSINITFSVGITDNIKDEPQSGEHMEQNAEYALQKVKRTGKNNFSVF